MENTVTMKLDVYDKMKRDYYIALEELRFERSKTQRMNDIKVALMEEMIDEYRIRNYSLEDLTNIKKWMFAIDGADKLINLGFELQEMIEFIKYKYEQYNKDDEVSENE